MKGFIKFLIATKKFWLLPGAIILLCLVALAVLGSGSAVAPFVYTLF